MQISSTAAEYSLQAEAKLRGLNLLCIALADGGYGVRVDNAALQKIEFVVMLKPFHREGIPRQQQLLRSLRREVCLVPRVVHCHHRAGAKEHRVSSIGGAQVNRQHARLPVVNMK